MGRTENTSVGSELPLIRGVEPPLPGAVMFKHPFPVHVDKPRRGQQAHAEPRDGAGDLVADEGVFELRRDSAFADQGGPRFLEGAEGLFLHLLRHQPDRFRAGFAEGTGVGKAETGTDFPVDVREMGGVDPVGEPGVDDEGGGNVPSFEAAASMPLRTCSSMTRVFDFLPRGEPLRNIHRIPRLLCYFSRFRRYRPTGRASDTGRTASGDGFLRR